MPKVPEFAGKLSRFPPAASAWADLWWRWALSLSVTFRPVRCCMQSSSRFRLDAVAPAVRASQRQGGLLRWRAVSIYTQTIRWCPQPTLRPRRAIQSNG